MFRTAAMLPLLLAACSTTQTGEPSLAPRAAEAVDPRVPIPSEVIAGPADPALAARIAELLADVRAGDAAFQSAAQDAERLAAAAGPAQSESWIAAQQALSAAVAAREPTARALGDIDALGAGALQDQGGLAPNDLAAIRSAGEEVGGMDRRQAARIESIQRRLGL